MKVGNTYETIINIITLSPEALAFYQKKDLDPSMKGRDPQEKETEGKKAMEIPEGVDAELLMKVLANPEMAALLTSLAKTMGKE